MIETRDLIGTPWRLEGTTPGEGLDCVTLVAEVYRRLGRPFPLPPTYTARHIDQAALEEWARHYHRGPPAPPAIVEIETHEGQHIGVLLAPDRVIHCEERRGVIVSRLHHIRPWVRGFWHLNADEEEAAA